MCAYLLKEAEQIENNQYEMCIILKMIDSPELMRESHPLNQRK